MITMTIKDKEFDRELKKFGKISGNELYLALVQSTTKMHKLAVNKAPVGDGGLRQGIEIDISRAKEFTGVVTSHKNYSQAVEEGTRPHHIEIRNKKVLAGAARKAPSGVPTSGGWAIYGKRVQHPGTKPQPFMYPAFTVAKNFLFKKIKKVF